MEEEVGVGGQAPSSMEGLEERAASSFRGPWRLGQEVEGVVEAFQLLKADQTFKEEPYC